MMKIGALRRIGVSLAWVAALLAAAPPLLAQGAASCPPTAQVPTQQQVQAGWRDARDHGFLWRVRRDGRDSFLFGTVHVGRAEWVYPGPGVMRALTASDTVALELDLIDPDIQRRLASNLAAPPASAARLAALPAPLQQRLHRQFEVACLPAPAMAALTPEMQVITLATLVGRRDGLDPSYGIDLFLAAWAHAEKKTVVSLETPELQAGLLRSDSMAERIKFVQSTLEQLESGSARPQLSRLTQAWAEGNLSELASYRDWCECLQTDADRTAMARLVDDRNPALADSITALHDAGKRVFAAVGSLHMTGPRGLPELLAQRGFSVERILPAP